MSAETATPSQVGWLRLLVVMSRDDDALLLRGRRPQSTNDAYVEAEWSGSAEGIREVISLRVDDSDPVKGRSITCDRPGDYQAKWTRRSRRSRRAQSNRPKTAAALSKCQEGSRGGGDRRTRRARDTSSVRRWARTSPATARDGPNASAMTRRDAAEPSIRRRVERCKDERQVQPICGRVRCGSPAQSTKVYASRGRSPTKRRIGLRRHGPATMAIVRDEPG